MLVGVVGAMWARPGGRRGIYVGDGVAAAGAGRVPGREGFDLRLGQDVLADVVDLPAVDLAPHDLVDESCLPLTDLPSPNLAVLSTPRLGLIILASGCG